MAVKLTTAQTLGFVTFLYEQVATTAVQPNPVIEWLAVPPLTLRNRWEALGIGLDADLYRVVVLLQASRAHAHGSPMCTCSWKLHVHVLMGTPRACL